MTTDPLNPYQEERQQSQGEREVENGNFLLSIFRLLKVPMPNERDPEAVERVGVLLTRRFPILAKWKAPRS